MLFPTCSSDGPYVFREQEGPLLRVDDVLHTYGNGEAWKDCNLWPMGAEELTLRKTAAKKAGEPTEKPGMVGLFCRAYDVPSAIAEFLSDVYAPCGNGGGDRRTDTPTPTAPRRQAPSSTTTGSSCTPTTPPTPAEAEV